MTIMNYNLLNTHRHVLVHERYVKLHTTWIVSICKVDTSFTQGSTWIWCSTDALEAFHIAIYNTIVYNLDKNEFYKWAH